MARPARGAARGAARVSRPVSGLLPRGSAAPGFALAGSDGGAHVLRDLLAGSRVLLAFYPGNDTPG